MFDIYFYMSVMSACGMDAPSQKNKSLRNTHFQGF
jgi:hypothetical protein